MNRIIGLVLVAAGMGLACNRTEPSSTTRDSELTQAPADNTKKNERDRNINALTPGDQADNEADVGVTQRVRQEVVKQDALSMTAKNVKIITQNGVVTLRGPVKSAEERAEIGRIAQGVAGVTRVDNQLEIASN